MKAWPEAPLIIPVKRLTTEKNSRNEHVSIQQRYAFLEIRF